MRVEAACAGRANLPCVAFSRSMLPPAPELSNIKNDWVGPGSLYVESGMPVEDIDTVVVGGGQAGIAISEHLSVHGVPHLVLERGRIAERWRSERWDSLVANGPAWHDRFPGMEFPNTHPDSFPNKETVADYFEAYAKKIAAPV